MRIKIDQEVREVDLTTMRRCKLMDLKLYVQTQKDMISGQLDQAAVAFRSGGERADPAWRQRARCALKMRCREIQAIDNELARRKREDTKELAHCFIDQARRLLDEDVFDNIMAAARDVADDRRAAARAQQL
jgi:hypothetical protein